jgi:TonB-linked SusC/RagA family outer membrane protein
MKICMNASCAHSPRMREFLYVMTFLMFMTIMQVSANSLAQKISFSKQNVTLKEFFYVIKKQTGYHISYSNQVINDATKIDVNFNNVLLETALTKVLNNLGVTFKISDNNITIRRVAQNSTSSGSVNEDLFLIKGFVFNTSEPPLPLQSVTVTVKGTQRKSTTEADGSFQIKVAKDEVLIFSMTGYHSREIPVPANRNSINVSLSENVSALEQVVVTGVGTQQVKNIASSVSVVNLSNINNKPITQLSQALQGGATGINVTQSSGLPGGDAAAIKIRGIASNLGSEPLVLVDGVPYGIDKLDPNTIESVSILKDAAAAAIYGARAGNGVIVITTKRGRPDIIELGYNSFFGYQQPTVGHPNFVDAPTYMEMVNLAQANIGATATYKQGAIDSTRFGLNPVLYPNTDWYKTVVKEWTPMQQHSLNVSGGNSTARFAVTATYLDQPNMLSVGGFNRATIRGNTSVNLSKNVVAFLDFVASRENIKETYVSGFGMAAILNYIYSVPPTIQAKYPNRADRPDYTYYGVFGENYNAVAQLEKGGTISTIKDDILLNLRPKWTIIPGLNLKGQFSYRILSGSVTASRDQYLFFDYFNDAKVGRDFESVRAASTSERRSYYYIGGNLDYNKSFGKHNVNAILLYSQEYDNPTLWDVKTLVSYLGKVYYSYDSRYLLELGLRRDGSSLFAPGKRWGYFPSVAAGWNIGNENFMKSLTFLSSMKLRASYGSLGNNNINPYAYQTTINTSGNEQVFGNPEITWEKMKILNIGTDISFFNNKLDFTFEWYNKATKDLILTPLPSLTSARGNTPTNIGELNNKGIEFKIGYNTVVNEDLKFSTSIGYSYNKTKIVKLATDLPIIQGNTRKIAGGAFTEFWGYKTSGLLTAQDLANKVPVMGGQQEGDIKYVDVNNDGLINTNDWTSLGNGDPLNTYFANISVAFKNFDFEVQLNGVGKNIKFYSGRYAYPLDIGGLGGTPFVEQTDYWTPTNLNARYPILRPTAGNNGQFSDYWVLNAGFTRVRYLQLGYTLPAAMTKKWAKNLRIYLNAQNPFTFSDMKMIDPESGGNQSTYSIMKVYTVGVNINL